jgi:thioredoxin 1
VKEEYLENRRNRKTPCGIIMLMLLASVLATLGSSGGPSLNEALAQAPAKSGGAGAQAAVSGLPLMVDVGADKCIPCKMMAPTLEDLKKNYSQSVQIKFVDVWKNPGAEKPYRVRVIPTQIFYDPSGKELFRHEGYYAKEDILGKLKELGFDVKKNPEAGTESSSTKETAPPKSGKR